ncbi:MAG: tetratricopeptide repeat protein [bacterium]
MSFFKSLFGRDVETYEKRAEAYMLSGRWGEARLELGSALQQLKDPQDPKRQEIEKKIEEATCHLARSHEEEGDHLRDSGLFKEAEEHYEMALSLFEKEEDLQRVEKKFSPKTASSPTSPSRFLLDEELVSPQASHPPAPTPIQGDPLEYFEVLVNTLDPHAAEEYRALGEDFALAYVHANHGDFKTAIEYYEKALMKHPGEGVLLKEMGRAFLFQGETASALNKLVSARKSLPDDLDLSYLLASAYAEDHDAEAAMAVLQDAQKRHPEEIEVFLVMGDLYVKGGEMAKAGAVYHEALKAAPESCEAHSRLGALALLQEDKSLAMTHYAEAVEHGKNVQDMVILAELYLHEAEDSDSALGLLNKALYYDSQRRWFYLVRIGEIYLQKGWNNEAREVLEQTRGLVPQDQKEVLQKINTFLET